MHSHLLLIILAHRERCRVIRPQWCFSPAGLSYQWVSARTELMIVRDETTAIITHFLLSKGEPLRLTPWGIVSGLFWVPGGWAGIYAIRTAGLAVACGTWSSTIVLTSFFWGIAVFEEEVKSVYRACCACFTLIVGLIGMSIFSRPQQVNPKIKEKAVDEGLSDYEEETQHSGESLTLDDDDADGVRKRVYSSQDLKMSIKGSPQRRDAFSPGMAKKKSEKHGNVTIIKRQPAPSSVPLTGLEVESLIEHDSLNDPLVRPAATAEIQRGRICGGLTKRQLGIIGALFNGLWGGTNMVPLHYAAHEGYGGPSYTISFACGSMLITIGCWFWRYIFELYQHDGSFSNAYHSLPSFHIKEMWLLGGLSGAIYSVGNFMTIISVTYLGQSVGFTFIQASMLISGSWGIFWFKEITDRAQIVKWLMSACIAISGILWLTHEKA